MLDSTIEQRVTNLEEIMSQAWRAIERTQRQVEQTSREVRTLQAEMRDFKDEMLAFKDEMRDFKDEMRVFKDEMVEFREETQADRKAMNKRWGELANKMGTMAEDLVAPSIPRILRILVGCPGEQIDSMAVRVRRRHSADYGHTQEFDVVVTCGDYLLINETKSSLNTKDVDDFVAQMMEARGFFPEHHDKRFIGAIASLYVDESIVRYGENQGLIVLGFGEDVMEVLNTPGFVPREF